jgi:hypothetical protein
LEDLARITLDDGDLGEAERLAEEGRSLLDAGDLTPNLEEVDSAFLEVLASVALELGHAAQARRLATELAGRPVGAAGRRYVLLLRAVDLLSLLGDRAAATRALDHASAQLSDSTGPSQRHWLGRFKAERAAVGRDLDAAAMHAADVLTEARTELPRAVARSIDALATYRVAVGDVVGARALVDDPDHVVPPADAGGALRIVAAAEGDVIAVRTLLQGWRARRRPSQRIIGLELLSEALAVSGDAVAAYELLGAATAERERLHLPARAVDDARLHRIRAATAAWPDQAELSAAEARGRTLDAELALEDALQIR